jgi:hypothetical protein
LKADARYLSRDQYAKASNRVLSTPAIINKNLLAALPFFRRRVCMIKRRVGWCTVAEKNGIDSLRCSRATTRNYL